MSRQFIEHRLPLLPDEDIETHADDRLIYGPEPTSYKQPYRRRSIILYLLLTVSVFLNLAQAWRGNGSRSYEVTKKLRPDESYCTCSLIIALTIDKLTKRWKLAAPVYGVVEYELRKFNRAAWKTKWHGPPSDAVDEAWESLYSCEYRY